MKTSVSFILLLFQFFQIKAQPKINSVSPLAAPAGSTITITGSGFSSTPADNFVYMGGIRALVLNASTTQLLVKSVAAATYSRVSVTCNGLTAYSPLSFSTSFPGTPGIGPGNFAPRKEYSVYRVSENGTLADIDGDGLADIIMPEYDQINAFEAAPTIFSVLRNTSTPGSISFAQKIKINVPPNISYSTVGDFDGDGKLDVALLSYAGNFYVVKNLSTPGQVAFDDSKSFPIGTNFTYDFQVADIDADGKPDIIGQLRSAITNKNSILICRNTTGLSGIAFDAPIELHGTSMSFGDINGDGKPELAMDSVVYENQSVPGDIKFVPVFAGTTAQVSKINDMDGDGRADFMLSKGGVTTIYRNNGSASINFEPGFKISTGTPNETIADINGDGKPDLININSTDDQIPNQTIMVNQSTPGSLSFGPGVNTGAIQFVFSVMVGDLDGDGKPEIINVASTNLSIHRNITGESLVAATGTQPVNGKIDTRVTINQAAPYYEGRPYVQRHYDIEPQINAAAATATVTLMFTQDEFDFYNSHPAHGLDLPSNPSDLIKRANLRITQHHGTSQTGVPGTYSGSVVEIDPDDSKIIWNELSKTWQVTFDVTGFSGFFAGSAPAVALPLTLKTFSVVREDQKARISWTTSNDVGLRQFDIQRSADGISFVTINTTPISAGRVYNYYDSPPAQYGYYYRVKMLEHDGNYAFSQVVYLSFNNDVRLAVFPNPAKNDITIGFPKSEHSYLKLFSSDGVLMQTIPLDKTSTTFRLNIEKLANGTYQLLWLNGKQVLRKLLLVQK